MLNTDARAAAWIVWLNALDGDTRLRPNDILILTAYHTALGSRPTTKKEDLEVLRIHQDFFANAIDRAGP